MVFGILAGKDVADEMPKLTVSTSPDFAAKWLVNRLGWFTVTPETVSAATDH